MKQKDLAKKAGVSQSFIAKLEAGKISPSYEKVKAIIFILEKTEHENQITAKEIMQPRVIYVMPADRLSRATSLMKKHGISQMPVLDKGISVGSISDRTIIDLISSDGNLKDISNLAVADVMDDSFPLISEDTPVSTVTALLKYDLSILVTRKGKIMGIISKADLLGAGR